MVPLRKTPDGDSGGEAGDVEKEGSLTGKPLCYEHLYELMYITSNREV